MCLIGIAMNEHPLYPFIFAGNRDEFYRRPTMKAQFWKESPSMLAGKDLEKGGTWLGITKKGDFAALTNVRKSETMDTEKLSRGELVKDFLEHPNINQFEKNLNLEKYAGFNLLYGNIKQLYYISNRSNARLTISKGIHALSNAALNTPWPKIESLKQKLNDLIRVECIEELQAGLFSALANENKYPENSLPDTGVGIELEHFLSPIYIKGEEYGTRSSTIVIVDREGKCRFIEKKTPIDSGSNVSNKFIFKLADQ